MSKDIIGISVGSKNTIVGTYKKGFFQVVLGETSGRVVPTVVSYHDRERNFAELSMHSNRSNFKRTIVYPNRWLGVQKNWPLVQEENKYAYVRAKEDKTGKVGFNISYKNKEEFYNPESLMGLFFSKLQKIWHRDGINTTEVVVSVPDYATAHERKAMLEAMRIGGLKSLALLNESSAIAFAYGFQHLKEFDDEKPRVVGFVDLGHSKTNVFFAKFTKKLVNVISVTSERFCGAREFDYLIAEKLAEDFEKKYRSNPMEAPKSKIRLIDTITKVRKSLTVNKEVSISAESLMDGEDLIHTLTRDEFEQIISPVTAKFRTICEAALKKLTEEAGVKIEEIHSVEMCGDTVRTPVVHEIVKDVFKKDVSKTLVPDECIARGCAIYAMMNSPYFSIQNFKFEHYNPYSIIMEYPLLNKDKSEVIKTQVILKRSSNFPATKTITFTSTQIPDKRQLPFKFFYDQKEISWLPNLLLNSYTVKLNEKKEKNWKFILKFEINIDCLPELKEAVLKETRVEKVVEKKVESNNAGNGSVNDSQKSGNVNNNNGNTNANNNANTNNNNNNANNNNNNTNNNPNQTTNTTNTANTTEKTNTTNQANNTSKNNQNPQTNTSASPQATAEQKSEPVIKEKTIETDTKLDVNVVEILYGTPKGILEQCEKREKAQSKEDEEFKEASNIKNSLEQYIYNARDKLDNLLKGYYTVDERKKLEGLMSQLMDWLYSDDTENLYNKSVLLQNSKEMSLLGDAIFRRESQWTRLRKDFEIGAQTLNELKAAAGAEKEKIAKKETCYLTEEDFGKIGKYLEEAERSLREKIKTSEGGLMVQEPNVNPDDVEGLVKNLRENVKKVYDDAEFKVKEAERKRKEEEEKKRKEEEEKKKKEEEEKKKKEGDKKEAGKEKEGKDEKKEEGPKDNKEQQPQPGTTKMDVE